MQGDLDGGYWLAMTDSMVARDLWVEDGTTMRIWQHINA